MYVADIVVGALSHAVDSLAIHVRNMHDRRDQSTTLAEFVQLSRSQSVYATPGGQPPHRVLIHIWLTETPNMQKPSGGTGKMLIAHLSGVIGSSNPAKFRPVCYLARRTTTSNTSLPRSVSDSYG